MSYTTIDNETIQLIAQLLYHLIITGACLVITQAHQVVASRTTQLGLFNHIETPLLFDWLSAKPIELFVSLTIALEEQYLMGPPIPTVPLNTMRGRDDIAQVDSTVTTNGAPSPIGRADSSNN